jgi:hypothetical protein
VGKVGGVSKNKIQWRRVNFVGNRCIYSNPATQACSTSFLISPFDFFDSSFAHCVLFAFFCLFVHADW